MGALDTHTIWTYVMVLPKCVELGCTARMNNHHVTRYAAILDLDKDTGCHRKSMILPEESNLLAINRNWHIGIGLSKVTISRALLRYQMKPC
jgi:hypothetical protein